MKYKLIYSIFLLSALTGCSDHAPECGASESKDLVMDISEKEIKEQLKYILYPNLMLEEAINIVRRANGEVFKNNEEEISDKVNESYEKANPKLENIRTDELDDKILKSSCSAQIVYQNGYVVDITYKLSYTSENQLFAKVFGLK